MTRKISAKRCNIGSIKVKQRMAVLGLKFGNQENEILVWVRNWELKTQTLKHKF
jgi:hypothetical protein